MDKLLLYALILAVIVWGIMWEIRRGK